MPEESKKNHQKGKNEPKDQRRRRQGRQPAGPVEKKAEKQPDRQVEKQSKEPEKPAYEPPGPEFYKNLKRETDEIVKITEETNTKYKKKEIQSNWAKYEMPIESYDEIDEQENIGADYEKLIQAPATVGGHFQFKHEKSWDMDAGPSIYDKYFDINMDLLSLAVSTIPFYERNSIEQSMFTENDIATMNHRATKFKQKYYNDKKYNTPELEAQEKILKSLSDNNGDPEIVKVEDCKEEINIHDIPSEKSLNVMDNTFVNTDMNIKEQDSEKEKSMPISTPLEENLSNVAERVEEIKLKQDVNTNLISINMLDNNTQLFEADETDKKDEIQKEPDIVFMKVNPEETKVNDASKVIANIEKPPSKDTPKNSVIESPEDLEKWLDDFLDG